MNIAQLDFTALEQQTISNLFAGEDLISIVNEFVGGYLFPIAIAVLTLYLLFGGYTYMLSGGDPAKVQKANGILTHAITGLIIVFCAYWIMQIIGTIFGISIINSIF